MSRQTKYRASLTFGFDGAEVCGGDYPNWANAIAFLKRSIREHEYASLDTWNIVCDSRNAPDEIKHLIDFGNKFYFARIAETSRAIAEEGRR